MEPLKIAPRRKELNNIELLRHGRRNKLSAENPCFRKHVQANGYSFESLL